MVALAVAAGTIHDVLALAVVVPLPFLVQEDRLYGLAFAYWAEEQTLPWEDVHQILLERCYRQEGQPVDLLHS